MSSSGLTRRYRAINPSPMKSKSFYFRLLLVAGMIVASLILYPKLPDTIPTHWGINGQPDDWGSKVWAAWLIPGISIVFMLLFPFLAKIDPKSENYKKFSGPYQAIQTLLIAFMAFIFFLQYYFTFYPARQELMTPIMLSAMGVMFIVLGNTMGKVRQNFFVGLKTPWTLADPEVWQKSQRLAGWMFVIAGIIFLLEAWLQLYVGIVFIIVILAIVLVPTVYSYLLFKKK